MGNKRKENDLAKEAKKMITDIKNSGCEACMHQVIDALVLIKNDHNANSCRRFKAWRCYEFRNHKLADKINKMLRG